MSIKAENVGKFSPNTASINITVGERTEARKWSLKTGDSESWSVNLSDDGFIFVSGVELSESELTVDEGGRGTYMVRLARAPELGETVTVEVSSSNPEVEVELPSDGLMFTANTWRDWKTVTVVASHDADAIDDTSILTHSIDGEEFDGRIVLVTVDDDDHDVELSESELTVDEGGRGTYMVRLARAPELGETVTVEVSSSNPEVEVELPSDGLMFTANTWRDWKTVTVVASHDADAIDDTSILTHSIDGEEFDGRIVLVTVDDDDHDVELSESELTVDEGGRGTYMVRLARAPELGETVTVEVSSSNPEVEVELPSDGLMFTANTWRDWKTVTVVASHDADAIDDTSILTHSIDGEEFDGRIVLVTVDDDDHDVELSESELTVDEGGRGTYMVRLARAPELGETVTVEVSSSNPEVEVELPSDGLMFTANTWRDWKTVTVVASHDADAIDDTSILTHSIDGEEFDGRIVLVTVDDDDHDVELSESELTVDEGGRGTYMVRLARAPELGETVTVEVSSSNPEVEVELPSDGLMFTANTWRDWKTVTVVASHDADAIDDTSILTHSIDGEEFDGRIVLVTVDDDDHDVELSESELTVDEGGRGTYMVRLARAPELGETVTVEVSSSNPEVEVELPSDGLMFTANTWRDWKTVTVVASHDADAIDDTSILTHSIDGEEFDGRIVLVTVDDDDHDVELSESELTVDEGGRGTYMVRLARAPELGETVTVEVSSSNPEVEVELPSDGLMFTANTWRDWKTVTVVASHDADAIDDTSILTHSIDGEEFDGRIVLVTVDDGDTAGVEVTPTMLELDEGSSETYTVALTSSHGPEGQGVVAVRPVSDNNGVVATPEVLTFTAANWSMAQTVTVRAENDDDITDYTAIITHEVSGYGEVMSADRVMVSVNDTATLPGAPRHLRATAGDGQVTLSWLAPQSDGGTRIIRYDYQVNPKIGGDDIGWKPTDWKPADGDAASHVVTNLTNGVRYAFAVRAINSINAQSPGSQSTSASVSAMPQISAEEKGAVAETVRAVTAATAANIAANIGTRFSTTRSGSTFVVGGQKVNLGPVSTTDLPLNCH